MHTLQEKNAALRERVMELSGVISRWREDLTESKRERDAGFYSSSELLADLEEQDDLAVQQADNIAALREAHENEIVLRTQTEQQRAKIMELEEALVVSLGQISHVEEREAGLRELLEVLRRGESDLKHRAAVQVSRVKQVC